MFLKGQGCRDSKNEQSLAGGAALHDTTAGHVSMHLSELTKWAKNERLTKFYYVENEVVKSQAEVTEGNLSCKTYPNPSWSAQDVNSTVLEGWLQTLDLSQPKQDGKNVSNKPLINFIFLFQMLQVMDHSLSSIHKSTYLRWTGCLDEGEKHWLILLWFLSVKQFPQTLKSGRSAENSRARERSCADHRSILRRPPNKKDLETVGKAKAWTAGLAHWNESGCHFWLSWELGAMFLNTLSKCQAVRWRIQLVRESKLCH